ncbi:MAG: adenylate/guanylate cyclase domain-containing protein [Bacillota bacterium]|nr:adenylate/guanylate cyclase domain-containing protein [Bacillota bacterium]
MAHRLGRWSGCWPWLLIAGTVALLWAVGAWQRLEFLSLDLRLRLRPLTGLHPAVAVVAVDDATLARLGSWPLPRRLHAQLIERLRAAGARAIAFDLILSEPNPADPAGDAALVAAVRRAGNVVFPLYSPTKVRPAGKVLFQLGPEVYTPFPALRAAAAGLGHILVVPEADGVIRRLPLAVAWEDRVIPALSLALLAAGRPPEVPGGPSAPALSSPELWLNFQARPGRGPVYSYYRVLAGEIPPEAFRQRFVLVGVTARGAADFFLTPLSAAGDPMAGVEIHAQALSNILEGRGIRRLPPLVTLFCIGAAAGAGELLFQRGSLLNRTQLLAVALAAWTGLGYLLFLRWNLWLELVPPAVALAVAYLRGASRAFSRLEREKAYLKHLFERYLSPEVVRELLLRPELAGLGGEKRLITVLFADLRGFTALAERVPPEEVVHLLNAYLSEMAEAVLAWGGTLDKFLGDGILALFGAPLPMPDHAERALKAACEIQERVQRLRTRRDLEGYPAPEVGIGIATGEAVIGNIGSRRRMEYTAIGHPVNLANRLEGLARPGEILLARSTYESLLHPPPVQLRPRLVLAEGDPGEEVLAVLPEERRGQRCEGVQSQGQ